MHPAVDALIGRVERLYVPGDELAVATDAEAFAKSKGKPPAVLVAIRRPSFVGVLAIDASEFDGLRLAELAGFPPAPAAVASAYEKAVKGA